MKNFRVTIYPLLVAFVLTLLAASMVAAAKAPLTLAGPPVTQKAAFAAAPQPDAGYSAPEYGASDRGLYIVQLAAAPLALYDGSLPGLPPTNPQALGETSLDLDAPASTDYLGYLQEQQAEVIAQAEALIGRQLAVRFSYTAAFAGFAAEITPLEASRIAALADVRQVAPDVLRELHTDVGPGWIAAPAIWDGSATGAASQGEGVTIGVIDTGANIDHPSFADPSPIDGFNYTNPLGAGVFKGLCATKPAQYRCNDKLLGYYIFTGETSDDTDGHGSHTASTSGGNRVAAVLDVSPTNPFSYPATISGVAPHAHLIVYDACLDSGGCPLTGLVAAIDQAVRDGVDVINYSIGGSSGDPWVDIDSQAFLGAVAAGIIPVASAGNSGPGPETVGSPAEAPWMLTVAASTHTRASGAALMNLTGGASAPPPTLNGQGLTVSYGPAPIVFAGKFGDPKCQTAFPANTWTHGEIVVCERGGNARTVKGTLVKKGGAGGVVLINTLASESLVADPYIIPGVHLGKADGDALKAWLATGSGHMATIQATQISIAPANADIMADFSSRGPNLNAARNVIKPDVTAPGVDVLAAYRSGSGPAGDAEPWMDEFTFLSGTSMSSPHVAGAAALLYDLHPTWTPMEIKSALMTTAIVAGVRKEDGSTPATPFDRGAGRIDVSRAAKAGMVLDISPAEFFAADPVAGGDPATLNLPSLANGACQEVCTWTRTVRNPTNQPLSFQASYVGIGVITVVPSRLSLEPGESASFRVTLDVSAAVRGQWGFGLLTWSEQADRASNAHFPLAVRPATPVAVIAVTPTELTSDQAPAQTTTQTLIIANHGGAALNWQTREEAKPLSPVLLETSSAPAGPSAFTPARVPVVLKLDDGRAEWNIDAPGGGQFLWLNRFTPDPNSFPISLEQVQVMFEGGGVDVGDLVDIYVYEDKDGDGNPGTGSVHRASLKNQAVQVTDGSAFSQFSFVSPVALNGPGDVLIGVVNRTAGVSSGEAPATLDINSIQRRRSWFGSYGGPPPDPPVLPAPANWGIINDLNFGSIGNWLIRGLGTGRGPCDAPADIPWLKAITPPNGSTPARSMTAVQFTLDSTGLAPGEYKANVCIDSNDTTNPRQVVPVRLHVSDAPAIHLLPTRLHAALAPGDQTEQPLAIRNYGGQNLTWTAFETNPTVQDSPSALTPTVMLYDQTDHPGTSAVLSQYFPDLNGRVRGADDFTVPAADGGWKIERVTVNGLYSLGAVAPNFDLVIYANSGGLPGAQVYQRASLVAANDQAGVVTFDLLPPALLPPGGYWLSVQANMAGNPGRKAWGWLTREVQSGRPYAWEDSNGLAGITQCATWKPGAAVCNIGGGIDPDLLFRLEGGRVATACSTAGDIGWARLAPAGGSTTPGASSAVQVTFDAAGLAPGDYAGTMCVGSNDPNDPFLLVPLTLDVTSPPPKLFLPWLAR